MQRLYAPVVYVSIQPSACSLLVCFPVFCSCVKRPLVTVIVLLLLLKVKSSGPQREKFLEKAVVFERDTESMMSWLSQMLTWLENCKKTKMQQEQREQTISVSLLNAKISLVGILSIQSATTKVCLSIVSCCFTRTCYFLLGFYIELPQLTMLRLYKYYT